MDVISNFAARFERTREEELSLEEYLAECKRNPLAYATAAERMLKAIGAEARGEIEALLDAKVFLELWVKVWKNWRKDPKALRALGLQA